MSLLPPIRARIMALLAVAALASCVREVVPAGTRYVVTAPRTGFYKYGPAQTFGPDSQLSQGEELTMMERGFGFSRVMTAHGVTGYVASDDIQLAPPELRAKSTPVPRTSAGPASKPGRSNVRGTPGSPLFDVREPPAPLPQGGSAPDPAVPFRY